jgi:hypothetical protein
MSKSKDQQKKELEESIERLHIMKYESIEALLSYQKKKLKEIEEIEEQNVEKKKRKSSSSNKVQEPNSKKKKVNNVSEVVSTEVDHSIVVFEPEDQISEFFNTLDTLTTYSDEEMNGWGKEKKKAWTNKLKNQNMYLQYFNDDGFEAKLGPWTDDEIRLFDEMYKQKGNKTWGEFSKDIPGRNGQQCCTFYHYKYK